VWLNGLPVRVMPRTAQLEMLGVAWLANEMGEIRLPLGLELERRRERRLDILELHALGWKPSSIARSLSLSLRKVKRELRDGEVPDVARDLSVRSA
jgi:DNA-binding NarL/FixJ family response regulator